MTLRPAMLSILLAAVVVSAPAAADATARSDDRAAYTLEFPALGGAGFAGLANFDRRISPANFAPGAEVMASNPVSVSLAPATLEPAAWSLLIAAVGLAGAALRTRRPPTSA